MRRIPANQARSGADAEPKPKELRFEGSAQRDMREMPEEIKDGFGYDLWLIQQGELIDKIHARYAAAKAAYTAEFGPEEKAK